MFSIREKMCLLQGMSVQPRFFHYEAHWNEMSSSSFLLHMKMEMDGFRPRGSFHIVQCLILFLAEEKHQRLHMVLCGITWWWVSHNNQIQVWYLILCSSEVFLIFQQMESLKQYKWRYLYLTHAINIQDLWASFAFVNCSFFSLRV